MDRLSSWRPQRPSGIVYAACGVSLALGMLFVFVWAPHPWGWEGFDHYHELALTLASGQPFPTMEVPWGYAYFAAAFYRTFGDRPVVLLVTQVLVNAAMPLLVYWFASMWTNRRAAVVAAIITGICSFNTVYASTQSSDAMCTVIVMAALVVFGIGRRRSGPVLFAAVGLMMGIAAQFRPNVIVFPACLAVYAWLEVRTLRRAFQSAVLLAFTALALTPWVVRNYQLTGSLIPTSVHGGVQLWYGTLQVGPYLRSRAYNPRAVFDAPAFDYTSLEDVPIVIDARFGCRERALDEVVLAYRVNASAERRILPTRTDGQHLSFEIPAPMTDAVIRYYLVSRWSDPSGPLVRTAPSLGLRAPSVYFVTRNHLGDLDVEGDLLDVFDLVRLMRRSAWGEEVPFDTAMRAAGIGNERDAVVALLQPLLGVAAGSSVAELRSDADEARMTFSDGSVIAVPRSWRGNVTDLTITRGLAATVMTLRRSLAALSVDAPARSSSLDTCLQSVAVSVNEVFYRNEPKMMQRYMALAFDNIRRSPLAFVQASLYRGVRIFVVEGASDSWTAQQFTRSGLIYAMATVASTAFLIVCAAGVVIGRRQGDAVALPLLLIASVPISLAPMLINMRYTVTIQPLMFIFAAIALSRFSAR